MDDCQDILGSIINNNADMVFALDPEKKYIFFNEVHKVAMKEKYGVDIEEGMSICDYIPGRVLAGICDETFAKAQKGETINFEYDFGNTTFFGGHASLNVFPLKKSGGLIIGVAVFARNISKEMELEQQNVEYVRMMEHIVSDLSHKLRKPVATILGLIQLIDADKEPEELGRVLDYLKESTDELDIHLRQMTKLLENKPRN